MKKQTDLPATLNAMTAGMGAICGALSRQMPPENVRQFESDLRSFASARKRAGDTSSQMLIEDLAASVRAIRPDLWQ